MSKRVLVLGISGMLGHETFRVLNALPELQVFGTVRSAQTLRFFPSSVAMQITVGTDVLDIDSLMHLMDQLRPDVIINCIGLVKQLKHANDPLAILPLNAVFPHRLARLAGLIGARVVHISTDCVFQGSRGQYTEDDTPDAVDLYGRSKLLGELYEGETITLRTSVIGHELQSKHSLVDWFLSSTEPVNGFSNAIFSGLTTYELAKVIGTVVLPRPDLKGLWHVSALPINKYRLLNLINGIYDKKLVIKKAPGIKIDRSLDSNKFAHATGYRAPEWKDMIETMHAMNVSRNL